MLVLNLVAKSVIEEVRGVSRGLFPLLINAGS